MSMHNQSIGYYTEYDLTILSIELAHEFKCPPGWHYEERCGRYCHGFVFVLDGSATYMTPDKIYTVHRGDILFLAKGSRYVTDGSSVIPYHHVVVSFQLGEDDSFPLMMNREVIKTTNTMYYRNMFHELANTWFDKAIAHKVKCRSVLNDIIYHILVDSVQTRFQNRYGKKLRATVKFMEEHFDQQLSTEELASIAHLSCTHFRRLFKEAYRLTPIQYLAFIRINRAKDLILSDMYSIGEIAERVGFPDLCYFSRVFRKHTGISPTAFKHRI